jgi:transposase InsO family protein
MDFITDLPLSDGYSQLWIIIGRFTQMAHVLQLKKYKKRAANLTLVCACKISKLQGIPTEIVSDWDSQLKSKFWKAFLMDIGMKPRMSTVFHPGTDYQTKRVNHILKAFLRVFFNLEMSD